MPLVGEQERTVRGRVAVAGVGESVYYRRGQSPDPEFVLVLKAILAACEDAGIDPPRHRRVLLVLQRPQRADPPRQPRSACKELRFSNMQWGGGGGGGSRRGGQRRGRRGGRLRRVVVAFRALAQGQFGRFGQGRAAADDRRRLAPSRVPYGLMSPAQMFAMRVTRFMHEHGVEPRHARRRSSLASYHHAQNNPRAVMHGRPLTAEDYDDSRWIVEPFRLFDCCQENDGAAAMILIAAGAGPGPAHRPGLRAGRAAGRPATARAPGAQRAGLRHLRLQDRRRRGCTSMAGVSPADVDVAQSYENFTGGVVMSLIEHGFCTPRTANEFLTFENLIAPSGKLPLNTSGGNLAECYMHGLELHVEAVRQMRGQSSNQVPDAKVSLRGRRGRW